jgi:hypothetical protein
MGGWIDGATKTEALRLGWNPENEKAASFAQTLPHPRP